MLGAVVGRILSGSRAGIASRPATPPVTKLAQELGEAWGPYHNR